MNRRLLRGILACGLIAAWAALPAGAEGSGGDDPVSLADHRYTDNTYGFALRPPAGCGADRRTRDLPGDRKQIVRFLESTRGWSLAVWRIERDRRARPDDILAGIEKELSSAAGGLKVLRSESGTIAARDAVRFAAHLVVEGSPVYHERAVIEVDERRSLALVLSAPRSDTPVAIRTFDRIVDSFELLRSSSRERQIRDALVQGGQVLHATARRVNGLADLVGEESFFDCRLDGRRAGFVHIGERTARFEGSRGAAFEKWTWLFHENGGVTHMRQAMFLADDLSFEHWESWILKISPPNQQGERRSELDVEKAVRQDDKLIVQSQPEPPAVENEEVTITVKPQFAPAPWDILLPRVLDLKRSELYAFWWYDPDRQGQSLRTFRVVGPELVRIDGRSTRAIKMEDCEGLVPPVHELHFDEEGRLMRALIKLPEREMEMIASNGESIQDRYGEKVAEAEALIRKYPPK